MAETSKPTSPPLTTRGPRGYVKIPALESEQCEKCHAENVGRKIYLWRIADERGAGLDCDVCAHYQAL